VAAHRDAPLRLPPTAITEYAVVLTADSILARSTRRRQTSTGWNTAYIGANYRPINPVPPMINVVMCASPLLRNGVADVLAKASSHLARRRNRQRRNAALRDPPALQPRHDLTQEIFGATRRHPRAYRPRGCHRRMDH
jgi:hypothetical protein